MSDSLRDNLGDLLGALSDVARGVLRVPFHLALVAVSLVIAIGSDRTAACFALSGIIMVAAWGWATAGVLIGVYGILLFVNEVLGSLPGLIFRSRNR